jgi:hypothetical protein
MPKIGQTYEEKESHGAILAPRCTILNRILAIEIQSYIKRKIH